MLDPVLRPVKDIALRPVARALVGVHPGLVTGAGLALGLASAGAAWQGSFRLALLLWLGNRILDGLDGAVAREGKRATDLGGFLDLVADFIVYAAIPLALAVRADAPPGLLEAVAVLLGTFYVNAAGWMIPAAILERRRATGGTPPSPTTVVIPEGLISGGETVLFYALFLALPEFQVPLVQTMAALTAVTILQRVAWARRAFAAPTEAPDSG
ncbi:MAG: CDP-alcohol phosphatidyltransferase family protein [Longimicrobiales bacterium]|nr:CDP-alcohol phosphatidyltransferase family protein [Longimicrobiales bacterium]